LCIVLLLVLHTFPTRRSSDLAVDNLSAEEVLLPLAQERGIAIMVYMPFGRTRLWNRVAGRDVPEWANEFGATTWGQFFLKFAASDRKSTRLNSSHVKNS